MLHNGLYDAYSYSSIALCVVDAVFSIGVRYRSTQNTVVHFCDYAGIFSQRSNWNFDQYEIDDLVSCLEKMSFDESADSVFRNRQRTSTKNGILKSEAVYRFAKVLQRNGIHTFSDFNRIGISKEAVEEIKKIPGQKSGLALRYFEMLSGDDSYCKPDRHVIRFLEHFLNRKLSIESAEQILRSSVKALNVDYPDLAVRELDYAIWR